MNTWSEAEQYYYLLLGERIKEMRTTGERLTQEALALRVGCSRAALSNWEGGKHAPNAYQIMRLCKGLDCEPDELLPAYPEDFDGLSDTPDTPAALRGTTAR